MIVAGNAFFGLSKSLYKLYPDAFFASRKTGYDLCKKEEQERFAEVCLEHDIVVICSALWRFEQTTLLDTVWKHCKENKHCPHIVVVGSTTDRVKNGKAWIYNAEKKALRDYSNTLGIAGVWGKAPKVSLISFGTLTNNAHKHPDRVVMDIDKAAEYIKWIIEQPKELVVNEISIDPMQDEIWQSKTGDES